VAATKQRESIKQAITRLEWAGAPTDAEELARRLDALVEAVEILARDRYQFPTMPESNLRSALWRARRR
jgi:hypothetical protein